MSIKQNPFKSPRSSVKLEEESCPESTLLLQKTLQTSNQFLLNQIDRNKKTIKCLQNFLAWISSCPSQISPELTSLMLSNHISTDSYDFELRLLSEFSKFICKSKYICFIIELVSVTGLSLSTTDVVPVEVKLYTSEDVPKQITHTMQGKQIIRGKGNDVIASHGGDGKFLVRIKMQITEVSSHFVNGTINLVVEKKDCSPISVKPLVIKDIVVKAKEKTCARWRQLSG